MSRLNAPPAADMLFAAAAPTASTAPTAAPALAPVATTVLGGPSEAGPPTSPASPLLYEGSQIQLWETVSPDDVAEAEHVLRKYSPRPGKLKEKLIFAVNYLIDDDAVSPKHRAEFVAKAVAKLRKMVPDENDPYGFLKMKGPSWVKTLLQPVATSLSSTAGAAGVPAQGTVQHTSMATMSPPRNQTGGHHTARTGLEDDPNEKSMLLASDPRVSTYGTLRDTAAGYIAVHPILAVTGVYVGLLLFIIVGVAGGYFLEAGL